jgi:hypothetical protein
MAEMDRPMSTDELIALAHEIRDRAQAQVDELRFFVAQLRKQLDVGKEEADERRQA